MSELTAEEILNLQIEKQMCEEENANLKAELAKCQQEGMYQAVPFHKRVE